jgi:hypothetical protein
LRLLLPPFLSYGGPETDLRFVAEQIKSVNKRSPYLRNNLPQLPDITAELNNFRHPLQVSHFPCLNYKKTARQESEKKFIKGLG